MSKQNIEEIINNRENFSVAGSYGISYLDDYLHGILAEDFVLIGAESGAGKTEIANQIAFHNARNGKRVLYFALEAETHEPYYREAYRIIAEKYYQDIRDKKDIKALDMSYRNYITNTIDVSKYERDVLSKLMDETQTLTIHYREAEFTVDTMRQTIKEYPADIIIIDHIDYFDLNSGENENAQVTEIMKEIRTINQIHKVPVVLISHLRKKYDKKQIIPDVDSFFGTSNKVKQAKTVVLLAPDYENQNIKAGLFSTYIRVAKLRIEGASNIVARCSFDRKINAYEDDYTLCKIKSFGQDVEVLSREDWPKWTRKKIPF